MGSAIAPNADPIIAARRQGSRYGPAQGRRTAGTKKGEGPSALPLPGSPTGPREVA